ncbi:hypothetical protein POM88_047446 [Heracleum sosnowskyi]|uniref:K-box domain-containing protein n=1 Tax=Heracleum sosnowskyi TaxID=360622 RepID=A0AAD8GU53_9APIA|nr:hypothetical protein POM88_047446 [Heracleum sosnowskyi]
MAKRAKLEVCDDRLSKLGDDLLCSILSFVDAKTAARTTCLSKRWEGLWSRMSVINFDFKQTENEFRNEEDQRNFIRHYLTRRDNLIKVSRLTLSFDFTPSNNLARGIIEYAIAHEVEEMVVDLVVDLYFDDEIEYVPCVTYSSTTLRKLVLFSDFLNEFYEKSWQLPNLHTLYLMAPGVVYDTSDVPLEYLTCLPSLKTLGLRRWELPSTLGLPDLTSLELNEMIYPEDTKVFFSTLLKLENLTLSFTGGMYTRIFVETPNLAHFNIIYPIDVMIDDMDDQRGKLMIRAPNLRTFTSVGLCPFTLEGIVNLEYVNIKLEDSDELRTITPLKKFEYRRRVVNDMLLGVSSATVLSLDFHLLKVFSELPDVIGCSPPVFRFLKYLKVPKDYEELSNARPLLKEYIVGLSTDADIITEFPKKKGVEEVKHLKKEIADLKAKTMQILGEASRLGYENLKQLEQVLDEGLASVKAKKDQLLKETKKKLDVSQKKEQEATVEIATLRSEEQKVAMEDATLKGKIEELQGQLEDRAPREYSPKSDETARQIKTGLFLRTTYMTKS